MAKKARKPSAKKSPAPSEWRQEALDYLMAFQARHIQAFCSLPELFVVVVSKHGASIAQFHDELRTLVQEGQVRLHPFSGARSALEREEYALMMGKDVMYYVERV